MFDGCENLATVTIGGTLDAINVDAFTGCSKLSTLNISSSVGTIGASAFEDSDALATVEITGTVDRVCNKAFYDCDAVETLAIRANTVEAYAYEDMDGLISATLYGATVGDGVFRYCDNLEELIIDGGVNSIGNDAFYACPSLASVTFNESANKLIIGCQPSSTDDVGPFYQSL